MKIKTVCEQTGLTDRAVRYYIAEGLISPDFEENYLGRKTFRFSEADVAALREIVVLRKIGFSVTEIKQMQEQPGQIPPLVAALRERTQAEITERQTCLSALERLEPAGLSSVPALTQALSASAAAVPVPRENPFRRLLSSSRDILWWLLFHLREIGTVLALAPPAVLIVWGIYLLIFTPLRLSINPLLVHLLLPGLTILLLLRMLRKEHPFLSSLLRTLGLWLLLVIGVFISSALFAREYHTVIQEDAEARFSESLGIFEPFFVPEPGTPVSAEYHECGKTQFIFGTHADVLLCRYTQEDYLREKTLLEERYVFQTEPLTCRAPDLESTAMFEPAIQIGDDLFRFVELSQDVPGVRFHTFYINCCLIVTNDERCEIAYLHRYDEEMDLITNMEEFIEDECCWSYIR